MSRITLTIEEGPDGIIIDVPEGGDFDPKGELTQAQAFLLILLRSIDLRAETDYNKGIANE